MVVQRSRYDEPVRKRNEEWQLTASEVKHRTNSWRSAITKRKVHEEDSEKKNANWKHAEMLESFVTVDLVDNKNIQNK